MSHRIAKNCHSRRLPSENLSRGRAVTAAPHLPVILPRYKPGESSTASPQLFQEIRCQRIFHRD
ncbi:unnamed protein product [Periconia digitata]|uniref:Uncharacterized protein n=1 Tax=Periconia digitata TaxID=1303443 RepID=A0A9W4U4X4_9PLEO|nr:unnamed protein product [Periconia digitata]